MKRKFTDQEIKFITENCERMTRKELAKALGRSTPVVTQKLLKINKQPLTLKAQSSNTWVKMFKFAKTLNPEYQKVTDAFNDYGVRNFKNLYKQHNA